MFPFDHAALPQLTTRKAFIGVDFQNDFIAKDGALPVNEPEGFVDRAVKLANEFRDVGDVVWVQSKFDSPQPWDDELIITNDLPPPSLPSKSRTTGRPKIPPELLQDQGPPDEEAFLSHEKPTCVKPDTSGSALAPAIEDASKKTDLKLTKTNYSAFQSTHLLRLLRAKMVMEVFICGSLTNVGVYATALDAAGHGMAITVVHDCCGYRIESRQSAAVAKLIELTGCEIASCEEVLEIIKPKPAKSKSKSKSKGKASAPSKPKDLEPQAKATSAAADENEDEEARRKSLTPEIVKNMTGLRIVSNSPSPARHTPTQPQGKASATSSAERLDSTSSKAEESNGSSKKKGKEKVDAVKNEQVPAAKKKNKEEPVASRSLESTSSTIVQPPIEAASSTPSPEPEPKPKQETKPKPQTEPEKKSETGTKTATESKPIPPSVTGPIEAEVMDDPASDKPNFLHKGLCEGDTDVIQDMIPGDLVDGIFDKLRDEVQWQRMSHQGGEVPRLVAVQGHVAQDGSIPVYRHPSDESPPLLPFSPTVLAIKAETEKHLGHELNHVLIQYYRDGSDYISEHSDKTLDIVQGSYIANVSLGAERTMVFRTKRLDKDPSRTDASSSDSKRQTQRAKLPNNSLCRLGLKSNMKWLHAIRQDKRAEREKTPAELAFNGGRISLTFRQIGTFLNREETLIWGQGATGKTRQDAHAVINGQSPEAIEMLKAFGTENHATDYDWDAHYGKGFDVLHMSNAPRLFSPADPVVASRVALMLSEFGVNHAKGSISSGDQPPSAIVKFVDKDKSAVQGDVAVMLYLDARYGAGKPGATARTPAELAVQFTRFQQGFAFLDKWKSLATDKDGKRDIKALKQELTTWDAHIAESEGNFLTGSKLTLPDFAFWPVLHAVVEEAGIDTLDGHDDLKKYYQTVAERPSTKKVTGRETKE